MVVKTPCLRCEDHVFLVDIPNPNWKEQLTQLAKSHEPFCSKVKMP